MAALALVAPQAAMAAEFIYQGVTFQNYVVPTTGVYDLYGAGGSGGYSNSLGGHGAAVSGRVSLQAGTRLSIVVAGAGGNASARALPGGTVVPSAGGGGGGATWVELYEPEGNRTRLLVAAGGGGGSATSYFNNQRVLGKNGDDALLEASSRGETFSPFGGGGQSGWGAFRDPTGQRSPMLGSHGNDMSGGAGGLIYFNTLGRYPLRDENGVWLYRGGVGGFGGGGGGGGYAEQGPFEYSMNGPLFYGFGGGGAGYVGGAGGAPSQGAQAGQSFLSSIVGNRQFSTASTYGNGFFSISLYAAAPPPGVPEPATWAMMMMGFGLIGTTLRIRHRAVPA